MSSSARGPALPLCLVGPRCVGKTTVGALLARRLGSTFVDLDDALVSDWHAAGGERAVASAGALLDELGLEAFRALEARTLARVLERGAGQVVATGGGCVEPAASRAILAERAFCVWLTADVDVLARRMRADDTPRPALERDDPVGELADVVRRREPLYRSVARGAVEAGDASPEIVATRVLDLV